MTTLEKVDEIEKILRDKNGNKLKRITDIVEAVEAKERKWIPVTERLPTFEERVLTTNTDGIIQEAKLEPCKYDDNEFFWMMPSGAYFHFNRIVAWMPLPESYKEEHNADD